MNIAPILKGRHAVVFGAGGSIGTAVANEFAVEGAEVFLSGRIKPGVDAVAKQIAAKGGLAQYTVEKDGVHPCSDGYPKFNAFVYSLETIVPLVKLGMSEHWAPNANRQASASGYRLRSPPKTGAWLRGYLWFHIMAGWVLTTLWVGGLTGLVKS